MRFKVFFYPDNKEIEVEEGTTLLKAAESLAISIVSYCGGEGVCGKCKVKLIKGKTKIDEHTLVFFSKKEIEEGYVLACQTKVFEDLEVFVPESSRLSDIRVFEEERERWRNSSPIAYPETEKLALFERKSDVFYYSPFLQKLFLSLPPPSTDDNVADTARIERELRKKLGQVKIKFCLPVLRSLSETLRKSKWEITLTFLREKEEIEIVNVESGNKTEEVFGLAIDIGTTTVVTELVDLKRGKSLDIEGSLNAQARYGEDVLSRIAYACGKGSVEPLQRAVVENINELINALLRRNEIKKGDIIAVVAAGNTTMSHIFLGIPPCSIREDPYVPTVDVYPLFKATDIGIDLPNARIFLMPSVASYVGGDTVAGVLATGIADSFELSCLIDIGTNGEIVIGNKDFLLSASASAGPAFEGGDIKWGMRAKEGAIEKVRIDGERVLFETIGNSKPKGICGSGLIDLIFELAKNGIIDIDGKFRKGSTKRLLEEDNELAFVVVNKEETGEDQIVLTQSDLDNLLRSKAAIFAAIKSLMDYVGLSFDDLKKVYVAGGFGTYLDIEKAIGIGLLPDIPRERIVFAGNTSLKGAKIALFSSFAIEKSIMIAQSITNIELSKYAPFAEEYLASLYIPHIERRLFPSVKIF